MLDSDPEYVEDLSVGESKTFESPMQNNGNQSGSCKSYIDEGDYK